MRPRARRIISGSPTPTSRMRRTICASWWRAPKRRQAGAGLADGEAVLHDRRRSVSDPGLRVLLRHALSLRLGERSASSKTAAAAGGCMLVRRERAGSAPAASTRSATRSSTIARWAGLMKAQGPIWLGLTDRAVILRPYRASRRHPPAWWRARPMRSSAIRRCCLLGTLLGMFVVYVARRCCGAVRAAASCAARRARWPGSIMAAMFQPMLRFYRLSPFWGFALPLIGAFYAAFTLDSAIQHWRGRGGMWKGRAQAMEQRHERGGRLAIRQGPPDENFPVASFLIAPRHRPPILAFYRFARAADDVADHRHRVAGGKARAAGRDARAP